MKLSAHYNKASIIVSVSVLLISGVVYYLIINHIARQQLDNDLSEEVEEVVDYVNHYQQLPKPIDFDEDVTTFAKTNATKFSTVFFDTPYNNPKEKKSEAGRAVSALIKVNGQGYIVTIVESREDTEYLIQIISAITLALTAVLLCVLIITNRFVLNGLWRPFYFLLQQVKKFNVADTVKIRTIDSTVDEFKDLSDAVAKMSSRVTTEYQGLKTFTENASHEMMTPLAVITSKLDMLIQDEKLSPEQYAQITDIYSAASRLSRLNQSLLLLAKIENQQFNNTQAMDMKEVMEEKILQFQELWQSHDITVRHELHDSYLNISPELLDILLNNLFSNASNHNVHNGYINIELEGNRFAISNTGLPGSLDEKRLFSRFYKEAVNSNSNGLGLSIIKQISKVSSVASSYQFANGMHCFILRW